MTAVISSQCAVLSSLVPSYTNERPIGELKTSAGHYDKTAFTPLPGAHGALDYGGVFAGKAGADVAIDQRQSARRALFATTEDTEHDVSGKTASAWAGCSSGAVEGTMLLPRELPLGARTTMNGQQQQRQQQPPLLRIAPAKEAEALRQGPPKTGAAPARFQATGTRLRWWSAAARQCKTSW